MESPRRRVLFLEPFYGGSHGAFADGLARHSRHEIVVLGLPASDWRRRMRLGARELAPRALALPGTFDAVIATDMLDLAAFLALTRARFARVPVLYYLHENQFTYPRIRGTKLNSWFGHINEFSAALADRVAFNSEYHRQDFLAALRELERQPTNWLPAGAAAEIEARSGVLPVGVELDWIDAQGIGRREPPGPAGPLVLWNHRWEFDKAPDVFARAVLQLAGEGLAFQVAIAGDPGANPHPAMAELPHALGPRVVHFGFAESREAYGRLLRSSHVTLSTTRHEFFGVGMVEALYAGCLPIAPARFTYPWLVPQALHERCLWDDEPALLAKLRAAILDPRVDTDLLRGSALRFCWERVAPQWDEAIDALAHATG